MAVSKPRNKLLIFRLTQDEYEALQQASSGSRSLSDFARAKLMGSLQSSPLDQDLSYLKSKVTRIAELLEKS
jgi:hypothetical protein